MGWGQQSQAVVSCRSEEPLLLPLQMVDDALSFSAPSPATYHPLPKVLHQPQVNVYSILNCGVGKPWQQGRSIVRMKGTVDITVIRQIRYSLARFCKLILVEKLNQ
jgi:hypothetical protein